MTQIGSLQNINGIAYSNPHNANYQAIKTAHNATDAEVTSQSIRINNLESGKADLTIQVPDLTLASDGWTLVSGFYEYDLADENITVNSIVGIIPEKAYMDIVTAAQIVNETDSSAGSVKVYAKNQPTGNIGVTLNITEKV